MPIDVIDAMSQGLIPRSHPEEQNNTCLCDSLNVLKSKVASMQELLNTTVEQNLRTREILKQRKHMWKTY